MSPSHRLCSAGDVECWRHQMETFSALLAICAGNSPVTDYFPAQWPVTRSFDVFFDLRLIEWFSKQSCGWWFETPSRPLRRRSNGLLIISQLMTNCDASTGKVISYSILFTAIFTTGRVRIIFIYIFYHLSTPLRENNCERGLLRMFINCSENEQSLATRIDNTDTYWRRVTHI